MKKPITFPPLSALVKEEANFLNKEAAQGASQLAQKPNRALMINRGEGLAILYSFTLDNQGNTRNLVDLTIEGVIETEELEIDILENAPAGNTRLFTVNKSAALKGFGPFMYDVGLSMNYPGWTVSDRDMVSDLAHRVWSTYLTGRPEVERFFLGSLVRKPPLPSSSSLSSSSTNAKANAKASSVVAVTEDVENYAGDVVEYLMSLIQSWEIIPDTFPGGAELESWKRQTMSRIRRQRNEGREMRDEEFLKELSEVVTQAETMVKAVPEAWGFRVKGPSLKAGGALGKLIQNHKSLLALGGGVTFQNLPPSMRLEELLRHRAHDFFHKNLQDRKSSFGGGSGSGGSEGK